MRLPVLAVFTLCWFAMVPAIAPAQEVDLSVWRSLPVFESKGSSGRVEPLQSFARQAMDEICDRTKGKMKLNLVDYAAQDADLAQTEYAPALDIFPEGKSRSFTAEELLLSWLAEPEKWYVVPFILAEHQDVRGIIGVPATNDRGLQLKYVSPKQIFESKSLREYVRELQKKEGPKQKPSDVEQQVYKMLNRYQRFHALTLDPTLPLTAGLIPAPGGRREFVGQINRIIELVTTPNAEGKTMGKLLQVFAQFPDEKLATAAAEAYVTTSEVERIGHALYGAYEEDLKGVVEPLEYSRDVKFKETVQTVLAMRKAVARLEKVLSEHFDQLLQQAQATPGGEFESLGPLFRELVDKTRDLKLLAFELNVAIYEDGNCLRVVPALSAGALAKDRDVKNKSQPWYSLAAVQYSDELMEDYPPSKVTDVKNAWRSLVKAYRDRNSGQRAADVLAAQTELYSALRALGEAVEPLREKLVVAELKPEQRDAANIAYTRWPDAFGLKRIAHELRYNAIDPFGWSWIISLVGIACFSLSFGALKKPMYVAAIAVLCGGILWSAYGFYLRVYVTQWAPVTNMYETVVWVAFCTALLGAWFLLLPLIWPGIKDGWRLSAFPYSFEATPLDSWQLKKMSPGGWLAGNVVFGIARLVLMAWVFYALAIDTRYSDGQRTIFALTPNFADIGSSTAQYGQQIVVWLVGMACMLMATWFVPRVTLALATALAFVPWDLNLRRGKELSHLASEVRARWPIGVGATLVSAFGAWVTWMAPSVLDESFSPLQPVLRSNFWLTVHVLTIVSSYAAGFLGFGIGLIALTYYLFGSYREPVHLTHVPGGLKPANSDDDGEQLLARRPPEACAALANYAYRAVQVAVLLLATGTILGGVWADRSWGRFWGWDAKEVWALVSLLVYLAILHGRFAGWFNNFGLIFGTVLGATAILMSWYGVNFILPLLAPDGKVGLHSYGSGAGGFPQVMAIVSVVWIYQFAATVRYMKETAVKVTPQVAPAEDVLPTGLDVAAPTRTR